MANRSDAPYEVLDAIVDISEYHNSVWLRLRWDGLPDEWDYTWAEAKDVYEDVPDILTVFLKTTPKNVLSAKAA